MTIYAANEFIGFGKGFSGKVWRLNLQYNDLVTPGLPKSTIVKFPSRTPEIRNILKIYYLNETNVYRTIGPNSGDRFPEIYFVESDSANGDMCIIMEGLGNESHDNNLNGTSMEKALAAARSIGNFHVRW